MSTLEPKSAAELRELYTQRGLTETDLGPDPLAQFREWFDQVRALQLPEHNAMALATTDKQGRPSARMVLLRGLDERGFVFFTNYDSRKGHELAENPFAALIFYWAELSRQVRVEGSVEKISGEESDAYFATRPRLSQLSAWASNQDQPIPNRALLEERMDVLAARYPNEVPRPPYWGGYRVVPEAIEFWQSRPNRLHDRFRYTRSPDGTWVIERLAP